MKTRISILLVGFNIVYIMHFGAFAEAQKTIVKWGGGTIGHQANPIGGLELDLWFTEESNKLIGELTVANAPSSRYEAADRVVQGEWRQGRFCPSVTLEVGDQYNGPWHSIPNQSDNAGGTRIVVKPGEIMREWRVNLERFREYIGKHHLGRIVLSSGDSAVFELSNLLPPK